MLNRALSASGREPARCGGTRSRRSTKLHLELLLRWSSSPLPLQPLERRIDLRAFLMARPRHLARDGARRFSGCEAPRQLRLDRLLHLGPPSLLLARPRHDQGHLSPCALLEAPRQLAQRAARNLFVQLRELARQRGRPVPKRCREIAQGLADPVPRLVQDERHGEPRKE